MLRKIGVGLVALGAAGGIAGWVLTAPQTADPAELAGLVPDLARGEYVFTAGGCASCHMAPGATGDAARVLVGGKAFASDFGTFYAPNITPDPIHGIGGWSDLDLLNALRHGTGREGEHLYPALPYAAYANMTAQDVVSLRAFLATLPADATPSKPHDVGFPFSIRRGLGLWKLMFLKDGWVLPAVPAEAEAGRYIAEALAHCGECHTPRGALGGLETARWLGGAPNPAGKGTIPNITPGGLEWSEEELVAFLQSGFTPEFDVTGGEMAEVVTNLATLPEADVRSLAIYLKSLVPVAD